MPFFQYNIQFFTDNDITLDTISELTDEHFKELKISIGNRIQLKNKVNVYKNIEQRKDQQDTDVSCNTDTKDTETKDTDVVRFFIIYRQIKKFFYF